MTDNGTSKPDGINPDPIKTDTIKLEQYLKLMGVVQTGGQAKLLIQSGEVKVNGKVETRRGRKLVGGDRVSTLGETFKVELHQTS
ncbi:RNA-binding S4 domain-containing protein [Kovacikia minuta CCNUW1]|uniref:RNA-binding S4 domain-containing protein n=1 Tax=Kovacikia minuta TaxID=2931930 RepID=UPI001CCB38F0|nr:RNA-binding S4 domain-containing protein [Kovacikia minuta]UBF25425.1 RNA-binding S4 domain-containing protein [Kovacikia minuta CCNUW1]